ncbi:acylneuraminate cytidylyltransferase family protein [Sulfurimonas sediminis]|uniref:Acylneuraminate cytidylyltransferase family protein n=1 Tax=Sulfurimonas sediminis TaxID=2590020 RepID=A0A7M1AZ70_9BACT|nr:acylneuraminate cytidylyltransferase family protein [Sulfurimonas sediminis]QOP42606.1 acylneuraminate cytidylyltransferase family protein [Sulfurimonas sediminis]
MLQDKTFLAIIPARGGSKRLPRKNVLNLAGKPLISWSIEAAKQSKYIDEIVVSSDDDEILGIAHSLNVTVLKRPATLSTDTATTFEVIQHLIKNFEKQYTHLILLQPTSPLRDSEDIDKAIELLDKKNADAVVSVCEMEHSPLWSNTLPKNKSMTTFLNKEILNKRSQDLETYYRLNGAIYVISVTKLLEKKSFFLEESIYAYVMDQKKSIDIDTKLDFEIASYLLSRLI